MLAGCDRVSCVVNLRSCLHISTRSGEPHAGGIRLRRLCLHLCPRCPPWGCETPEINFPTTARNAHRPYILPIVSALSCFRNSKYIARRFHNGFLQVAVSKTLRRSGVLRPPKSSSPDRSRYSPKTSSSRPSQPRGWALSGKLTARPPPCRRCWLRGVARLVQPVRSVLAVRITGALAIPPVNTTTKVLNPS